MDEKKTTKQIFPHVVDVVIPSFNARKTIQKPVTSTLNQGLPDNWKQNVIIVNDGSTDDTAVFCKSMFGEQVQIISHEQNRGRSASRNTGWRAGSGRYVVFLDADCEWKTTSSLAAHLKVLETGADVSTGSIFAHGQDFWAEYQNNLQRDREHNFKSGNHAAFTSANFAIRRSALEVSGGFDEGYRYYGFEDRDFLLRLISLGAKISFCPEAAIIHKPDSSLKDISRKMMESGHKSSGRFQVVHPEFYAQSSYGRIDYKLIGFSLKALTMISIPLLPWLIKLGNKVINTPGVSFRTKSFCLKIIAGLAYLEGTRRK